MGNQLRLSIKDIRWETEENGSTLDTQETEQQQLVYITNLEDDLQKNGKNSKKKNAQKMKSLQ